MELELGSLLKRARQEKGLSLDDIQEETKIRKKYLEAIEENNFDVLPGNVYLKVFIKGYAREVGIDYQKLLENYEILTIKDEKKSKLDQDYLEGQKISSSSQKNKKKKNPLKIILIILLILFLGAAGVYTYQYVNNSKIRLLNQQNSQNNNIEEESELLESGDEEEIISESETEVSEGEDTEEDNPENETAAELEIFDEDSGSDDLNNDFFDSFESDVFTEENTEIIDQNNINELDGLDSQEQNQISEIIVSEDVENQDESDLVENQNGEVDSSNDETDSQDSQENEAESSAANEEEEDFENELSIIADDTVWVTIDLDGENVFSGILEEGDQQEFEIEDRLYIKIGNASAVTAEIGGESYGPWADGGAIAEVEFVNSGEEITINNLRE